MKIIVKKFWVHFLVAVIVVGSIGMTNLSAMAEIIGTDNKTGHTTEAIRVASPRNGTVIPTNLVKFVGKQVATYSDSQEVNGREGLIPLDLTSDDQTAFNNMITNGFAAGYIDKDTFGALPSGYTFKGIYLDLGAETHKITYMTQVGDDTYYLTEQMKQEGVQATVLATVASETEFWVCYEAPDQTSIPVDLNLTQLVSILGGIDHLSDVTIELNSKPLIFNEETGMPEWEDGTTMTGLYLSTGGYISVSMTYPNKYNVGISLSNADIIGGEPAEINVGENRLKKNYILKIRNKEQIADIDNAKIQVTWDFNTNKLFTQAHLIGIVDMTDHSLLGASSSGDTRIEYYNSENPTDKTTWMYLNYGLYGPTGTTIPEFHNWTGPIAGKPQTDSVVASTLKWGYWGYFVGLQDPPRTQAPRPVSAADRARIGYDVNFKADIFEGYDIQFYNQSGELTATTQNKADVTANGTYTSTVGEKTSHLFLNSYNNNDKLNPTNYNVFTIESNWSAARAGWVAQTNTPNYDNYIDKVRFGEILPSVLRYDVWAPEDHMATVDENGNVLMNEEGIVYTEYIEIPYFPEFFYDLFQDGENSAKYQAMRSTAGSVANYANDPGVDCYYDVAYFDGVDPSKFITTHTTKDGAIVTITLKKIGISELNDSDEWVALNTAAGMDKWHGRGGFKFQWEVKIEGATRDVRLSFENTVTKENTGEATAVISQGNVDSISTINPTNGTSTTLTDGQNIYDATYSTNQCDHTGVTSQIPAGTGNYIPIAVTVQKGIGGVTPTITVNGKDYPLTNYGDFLQLCHTSESVDADTGEVMTTYHYHWYADAFSAIAATTSTGGTAKTFFSKILTFKTTDMYTADLLYKNPTDAQATAANTNFSSIGNIDAASLYHKNFLSGGSSANSSMRVSGQVPSNMPRSKIFGGWKLALYDTQSNSYVTKTGTKSAIPVFIDMTGTDVTGTTANNMQPFSDGEDLELSWVYDQFSLNDYVKANASAQNFEVHMVPIYHNQGFEGVSMLQGEVQFFYQGNTGSVHETSINNDEYSHYQGEKETKAVPSNSTILSFSSHDVLPSLARFKGDWSGGNRFSGVKFWFNEALSIINSDEISNAQPDSNGMHVISKLYYDRVFNVQYATNQMSADGIPMDGITQDIGEHTLTSGNGSVVTLNSTLANNNQITKWEIQELADANIEHTLTVTDGTIDLSSLSNEAKTRLLEMNAENNSAAYTTVTLRGRVTPPLEIVGQSREDVLWINGDNLADKDFIWVDLVSPWTTVNAIHDNIYRTLVRIRGSEETEFTFVRGSSGEPIDASSIPVSGVENCMRLSFQLKNGSDVQDGDQFYIKLSLKSDLDTFVTSEPITARLVNLVDDSLVAGIDGMVSMPSNVILAEQDDGTLASSLQDITLNPFGHTKTADHWDDTNPDYNWKTTDTRINVQVVNPLITLTSSRTSERSFTAHVQNIDGQDLTANTTFGSFMYSTSGDVQRLVQYKVVAQKPIGAGRGEEYTGTLTFNFSTSST